MTIVYIGMMAKFIAAFQLRFNHKFDFCISIFYQRKLQPILWDIIYRHLFANKMMQIY